ncbi:MAG: FtsX-like permease family protein, partial [Eubacteriales bacterium]
MKLSHLALLNIRHNLKRYAMYLFAMVFCIFTVHTFLTLTYSESVLEAVSAGSNTYRTLFLVFALVVIAFTLFFLISSNNSFIRARKKELSTYALFGMTNGRIGRLMLMEVMMLGTVALVIGILLSLFFSKLVVMILLKLALANISGNVVFAIEPKAIVLTIGVYYFIFLLMGLTGLRVISRFQLVDLFKGDQIAEKRTGGSTALLIISIIMIVGGYLISFFGPASMVGALMLPIIGTVVVGTYLFFWSGLPKMLKVRKDKGKNKGNGERMVSTALLSHRTRTVSSMMATIAV